MFIFFTESSSDEPDHQTSLETGQAKIIIESNKESLKQSYQNSRGAKTKVLGANEMLPVPVTSYLGEVLKMEFPTTLAFPLFYSLNA